MSHARSTSISLARKLWVHAAFFVAVGALTGRATSIVPPEFPALVNGSDYIVRAVVTEVGTEKRVGPRGPKIVTRVSLDVLEVVAGQPPKVVVLEMLGGRVGEEELRVGGMPQFKVGDEDILFVSGNGRTICPLYAMQHGRFPVVDSPALGRKYIARADGQPLQATAESAQPLGEAAGGGRRPAASSALAPEEFIRQIKAIRGARAQP